MNKSMYLLEVCEKSIYGNECIFKRRISDSIMSIEDWIDANAQKWVLFPVSVEHDGYGNGRIYLTDNIDCVPYTFRTTNIAWLPKE